MYNKLFAKILDSSIWTEPTATRIVWLTFIAAMDEVGFVAFASTKNVAHRAIVTLDEAEAAIKCLESPDKDSFDPDNDGRRIERVTGGWMVLNAGKYRAIATREHQKELNRNRVAEFRKRKSCNGGVMDDNDSVTPSEAEEEAYTEELEGGGSQSRVVIPPRNQPTITPNQLKTLWNTLVPSLNPCLSVSAARLKSAKARGSEQEIARVFSMVEASDFLTGREKRESHVNWRPSLDWVLNPSNFTKIAEGNYTNKPRTNPQRSDSANAPGRYG